MGFTQTESAHDISDEFSAKEGWTLAGTLDVVLDYIDAQEGNSAFRDYLADRAGLEPHTQHYIAHRVNIHGNDKWLIDRKPNDGIMNLPGSLSETTIMQILEALESEKG